MTFSVRPLAELLHCRPTKRPLSSRPYTSTPFWRCPRRPCIVKSAFFHRFFAAAHTITSNSSQDFGGGIRELTYVGMPHYRGTPTSKRGPNPLPAIPVRVEHLGSRRFPSLVSACAPGRLC